MPYITRNEKKEIIGVFECEQYKDQEYLKEIPVSYYDAEKKKQKAEELYLKLKNSDWIIRRHHDQKELKVKPKLSENEYKKILEDRENWRNEIDKL